MKTYSRYRNQIILLATCFLSILVSGQDSNQDTFLRDHLMVYYVEDPSTDQYRLLSHDEISSGQRLFGGNPQMAVAQELIHEIYTPVEDASFQESVVQALGRYPHPMALFLYFERGPVDEAAAAANWTNCIENGQFTSCVTVEADDEYAGIIHYGSEQLSQEGLLEAKSHFLQLLNDAEEGAQRSRPFAAISDETVSRARQIANVPERGFRVERRGRTVPFNISLSRMRELQQALQDPAIQEHIRTTLDLFENETGDTQRSRDEIDLPLVLAIASRESGVRLPLARGERRVVTAGRDAHTRGESGLDWLYDRRSDFPSSIRSEILPVEGNSGIPGHFRRECHPAYVKEKHMLTSFIVEVAGRRQSFINRFNRAFADRHGFTEEQRNALVENLSSSANRAWIQAAFGSRSVDILHAVRRFIRAEMRAGTDFTTIARNNEINLNAIVTNDRIMPTSLSRQRTRLSLAEAIIVSSFLPNNL
ncbi:hypothetical protein [Muriicola sp. Z0-33]|uniref:hypothetical protein n=1 Tax=Muriicola sp. Z0-33 TaxID=2816957 RepID=UPI0022373432|nr:hypothetical protein [Muriicola sp. Z0-33]MCW5516882.1 hypothetical protein [Muriicola sp. Z0-33]